MYRNLLVGRTEKDTEWEVLKIISGPHMDIRERFFVMAMMFGAHVDQHDYHFTGLDEDFLHAFLQETGFVNVRRVSSFGFFNDTSNKHYKGIPISLNMIAEKPSGSQT